ncbi:CocE/NonD family hydrolase [Hymenobacter sp. BT683]|uniref:CocE/NonD family hydrolase n=1 Tax=Hymenobacter jeongseonensis TaxID=2791027 RepID=A0ABS0IC45_9BACT|nr:CocE/NonD family hydrolase [Hymenobacter jeongseonensis]MBF9235885.1 CocE/NonD family hydrolase [Hymenobacter jeongseonensis]
MTKSFLFLLLLLVLPAFAQAQPSANAATPAKTNSDAKAVTFIWGQKIPVRDGVKLNGTVFKPRVMAQPLPVIFTFTPYVGDAYQDRAMYFARHGYVYVLVDVRGRGNSEGKFAPFENEGRDGYDVVEWLAKQPWCNGKVAMWGGSYAGFDQWSTAKELPPHLTTMVPAASVYPGLDFPARNNMITPYTMQWLSYTSGNTGNDKLFGDYGFWRQNFVTMYEHHLPFQRLDSLVGNPTTAFQTWLKHPAADAYWDALVPNATQYQQLNIPILTITGHFDGDQFGALGYYRQHMQHGSATAKQNHYLVMGPYNHPGTRTPVGALGGLKFSPAALLDLNKLHKEWYDWTMKSGPKPSFLQKRVACYVMGQETWKYADDLETLANQKQLFYLSSMPGQGHDVFQAGSLSAAKPTGKSNPDTFTNNPLDNSFINDTTGSAEYYLDQHAVVALADKGLIYQSAPFAEDTEITGQLKFSAWLALNVPDTDLEVGVYEIRPDGSSIYLTTDVKRARYRESLREARLVKPGAVNRYTFDTFMFFSRTVKRGSRLRLVLTTPNPMASARNYNGGGNPTAESGKDARTAVISVYHDAQHPSALELPIVKKPLGTAAR